MRGGIWVLSFFAAVWGVAGISVGQMPMWLAVIPLGISGALLLWAHRQPVGSAKPVGNEHVGRIVGVATAVEGIAIFVTANILINLHLPTLLMPAIAIIVGLHFLPLARGIPAPLYYRTGGALIAVGLAAMLLSPPNRAIATGVAAALVLWASALAWILRVRQAAAGVG